MYKIVTETSRTIGITDAIKRIRDHSNIAVLKITFSKGAAQYYKLSKTSTGSFFWASLAHIGILNANPPREDDDKLYPSMHTALEGILADPCKDQHHLSLFSNLRELAEWLVKELQ